MCRSGASPSLLSYLSPEKPHRGLRTPGAPTCVSRSSILALAAACDGKNSSFCGLYYDYGYTGVSRAGGRCCSDQTDFLCVYPPPAALPAATPANTLKVRRRDATTPANTLKVRRRDAAVGGTGREVETMGASRSGVTACPCVGSVGAAGG